MENAQTDGKDKVQLIKDIGGKLLVGVILAASGFLWGTAQEKGALTRQVEVNTGRLNVIEAEIKEFRNLRVEIAELKGELKSFRTELRTRR